MVQSGRRFFYQDVVFSGYTRLYTFPEQNSSLSIVTESDKIFHGGGYIAELKRKRRESEDTVYNLLDSGWLDARIKIQRGLDVELEDDLKVTLSDLAVLVQRIAISNQILCESFKFNDEQRSQFNYLLEKCNNMISDLKKIL
ncbi:uncharacterized protein LOC124366469 [Homalodisca vitripennis]|uniref:uncharacterized protein LOC124366469 n=1 Tax=Homalodisca vitripennis TaxID=197043 RepID=UPI001EEB4D2D|nr:uncharacterized protein LOC124366469 [Homalodisca vitripennis]